MNQRKKVVLVGAGRMGRNHLRVLRELPELFEVVAVVDPVATAPAGVSIPFVKTLADVKGKDFDAAVVATPTALHFDVASELIEMKKHLLIEKPVASTYSQARQLIEAAREAKLLLAVGHVERFNPAVRKLREIIREGWLGTAIHFSFTRVGGYPETLIQGNNVLLDLAVHDIDVLRSLVGQLRLEASMCHSTWREGVYDTAEIFLRAAKGPSASVHVNWITPTKIRSIRVTGTRGVCFVDYIMQTCELFGGNLLKQLEPTSSSFDSLQVLYKTSDKIAFGVHKEEPLRAQAVQFHGLLNGGESGELCMDRDALAAVLLTERAVLDGQARTRSPSIVPGDALPREQDEWV